MGKTKSAQRTKKYFERLRKSNPEKYAIYLSKGREKAKIKRKEKKDSDIKRRYNYISLKMATVTPYQKRLYLTRKANESIAYLESVAPNALNGVRFLYKQFVQQRPGVIINDPPDYAQESVAMFLRAQGLDLLLKPVLILCHSTKMSIWINSLMKWMPNYNEEVSIDQVRPKTTKTVYVITADNLESYCSRDWGVAVIDDDAFLQYKLPANTFRVLFKIYITTDDLWQNLGKFAQIHKWLYPDINLDVDQFRPKKHTITEFLEKRTWFSAFTEDLLLRCQSRGPVDRTPEPVEPTPTPKITRKNKDATGTKIKRTKRKVEDDNTESTNKKFVVSNIPENINVTGPTNDNMDIESFIREQEPLKMDELNDIPDIDLPLDSDKSDEEKSEDLEENGDDMKLNYSEDLDTDDAVYALETQEDVIRNDVLQSKASEVGNILCNDNDNTNDVEEKVHTEKVVEDTSDENTTNSDAKEIDKENSESNNFADSIELENGNLDSKETNDVQIGNGNETKSESKDEVKPIKENGVKKEGSKSDDLDSKWEEIAAKKFKGSLLDRIF